MLIAFSVVGVPQSAHHRGGHRVGVEPSDLWRPALSSNTCQPEEFPDGRGLGIRVGLGISREPGGQDALQAGKVAGRFGMGSQVVAKVDIVEPQRTVFFNQMYVVGLGLAAAEELSAGQTVLAAMLVTGALKSGNIVLRRRISGAAGRDIEDRLGAHTSDRGTADMFELQRQRATLVANPLLFSGKKRRPLGVVADNADHARLEPESVSHPDRLTHPYVDAPIVGQATRRLLEVRSQLTEPRGFEYSCH